MELLIVSQTLEQMEQGKAAITEADKEFVVQFAFATGDKELTGKLIDELTAKEADKEAVYRKYETLTGFQPEWIKKIEHLLIALERYRIQEDNCVGCCVCVDVCPAGAIREVNYAPVMNPSRCTGCRKCEAMCPMGAIEPMVYYPSI